MNVHRFRRVCKYTNLYLNNFRCVQNLSKAESEIELLTKQEAQCSQISSGITVASVENYSPITRVCMAVKAGSRFENGKNLGITHCLRNCASLATENQTEFSLTRNLESMGAKLHATSTREYMLYNLECSRDDINDGLEILGDIVCNPAYKPWEVEEAAHRMELDLAHHQCNPDAVLLEALHQIAFKGGLGNSLYSPSFMVGKHNDEMLHSFFQQRYTPSSTSIVGLGIEYDHLQEISQLFGNSLSMGAAAGNNGTASKFYPGELRLERNLPFVHTAIVAEGAGVSNMKELLSLGVLQCILGLGSHISLGGCQFNKLGEAAAKCTRHPFYVSGMNINYSDSGIFGMYIIGKPEDMNSLVKSVVSQMRSIAKNITENDVSIAKHKLKAKLMMERETSNDLLTAMTLEVAGSGKLKNHNDLLAEIDAIKATDVSTVAARVMKAKPAMASIGRLHSTPYMDELL